MEHRTAARAPISAALLWTLKLFAIVAIGFEALYLVVMNLMLWACLRPLLRWAEPEQIHLEYAFAYSLLPGDVHATDLHLTNQDSVLQWGIKLDRVAFHIELGELFSRRVHITHVRGSGLVFRTRLKLTPDEANLPAARALPPVEGYADPPIVDASVRPTPPEEAYHLWSAELDDVDTELRELWIHHYRFTGDARVRGSFAIQPLRSVAIDATGITLHDGEVSLAEHVVARALSGSFAGRVDTFEPLVATGSDLLHHLHGRVDLTAETPGAAFVSFYRPEGEVTLEDGSGSIKIAAAIDRGELAEGSEASIEAAHLVIDGLDRRVILGAEIAVKVTRAGGSTPRLFASLRVPEARMSRPRESVTPLFADRIRLDVETRSADLADLGLTGVVFDLPSARLGDLRLLSEARAADAFALLGGFAELAAHIEVDGSGKGGGLLRASARGARVRVGTGSMTADLSASAEVRGLDLGARTARIPSAKIEAKSLRLAGQDGALAALSARLQIDSARVSLGDRPGFAAGLKLDGSDAAALFDFAGLRGPLRWAADLLDVHAFAGEAGITTEGGAIDLDLRTLKSGAVEGRGYLRVIEGRRTGAFVLRAGLMAAGVSLGRGGVSITPFPGDDWLVRAKGSAGR